MNLRLSLAGGLAAAIALALVAPVAAAPSPTMGPAAAGYGAQSEPDGIRVGFDVHDRAHIRGQLRQLHDDAVAMQTADGGQLSDAHRAELDQRLQLLHKEACSARLSGC